AESVAAIVIEPVQGEGGFVVAPPEFLEGIRRICDDNGIVLVVDEVQTGYGRTGKMWGIEHYDVEPDVMTIAKSIAAGLPLSGVIGKAAIMDAPGDSAIGGTYVGNPVAQAAALAVLDVFEDESLVERAAQIGETIRGRMEAWQQRWDAIGDVRGLGAMLAIELVHDRATKDPAPELPSPVVDAASARRLQLLKSRLYSDGMHLGVRPGRRASPGRSGPPPRSHLVPDWPRRPSLRALVRRLVARNAPQKGACSLIPGIRRGTGG